MTTTTTSHPADCHRCPAIHAPAAAADWLVNDYREAAAAYRRMTSPTAAAQRSGRNSAAAERTTIAKAERMDHAAAALADRFGAPHEVTGALTSEHRLLARGVAGRPELRARLRADRATVAAWLATVGA